MAKSCIIIGGGIAGLTSALTLSRIGITPTVFELRPVPSTIGGAINLTPNARKLLQSLEVEVSGCRVDAIEIYSLHTGKNLGEMPFRKHGPALRVLREDLVRALLLAVEKKGIVVKFGHKLVSIKDENGGPKSKVTAVFENGEEEEADFILGCDGIHSAVRTQYVEPDRPSTYTNVAVAYSIVDGTGIGAHFDQSSMNTGRYGPLLASYVDPEKKKIYVGAAMETPEEKDKQGWKARGNDKKKTLEEIERRYKETAIPCVNELVKRVEEFSFYPVYTLGPGGKWSSGRVLLLGDAAHGMPPQGESTGLALEDALLLGRVFSSRRESSIQEIFQIYEKTRRPRIDAAYKEAMMRWEKVKDRSWWMQKVVESLISIIVWAKTSSFEQSMAYNVQEEKIVE